MSYDGALEIKIINKKLGEFIRNFKEPELDLSLFTDSRYDLFYEYFDAAYVSGCPENFAEVKDKLLQLFYVYSENDRLSKEFEREYDKIFTEESCSYIFWDYCPGDMHGDEEGVFEYGVDDSCNSKSNPSTPDKVGMSLYDIFPNINESEDTGLVLNDKNAAVDIVYSQHCKFLGEPDGLCLYVPQHVTKVRQNLFNCPGETFRKIVIANNLKDFDLDFAPSLIGIEEFYIIDAETKKVVFFSDRFLPPDDWNRYYMQAWADDFYDALNTYLPEDDGDEDYDEEEEDW